MSKKKVQNYVYKLNEILGQGSFGTVYKGKDQTTKQEVAVKVLNKKKINLDQYMRQALRLEIKILNKIKSENIVRFRDVIETSNNYYIIQQFCNQGDMGRLLRQLKMIPEEKAIDYMAQILTGFYQLIRQGIVHRDMKPENILIKDGILKLLILVQQDQLMIQSYFSQVLGRHCINLHSYWHFRNTPTNAMYGHQMLYGKLPWKSGGSLKTLLDNIKTKKLQFPQQPEVSKQTKNFITDCLQVKQEDRADWSSIYSCIIFKGKVPKYQNLTEVFNYIVAKLRKSIHENNLNLQMFFKSQKLQKGSTLNKKQFSHMMFKLSKQLTDHEIQYMFTKFDEDRNGQIEFQQFKNCLEEAQIRKTSMNRRDIKKILSIAFQDQVVKANQYLQEQFSVLADRIKIKMQMNQIYDIYQIFIDCDKSREGYLKFDTMWDLLKKIDQTITQHEANVVFKKFDNNNDQKVSFQEFYKNMCLITGSPIMSESKKLN